MSKSEEAVVLGLAHATAASCCVGRLASVSAQGRPRVDFEGNPGAPCEARVACGDFDAGQSLPVGTELLLQFERGDPARPIVVGVLRSPADPPPAVAEVDGETVVIHGRSRVELCCGRASIVLTADGKIVLKGTHLVSRSSGPNKIRGATVDIN